MASTTACESVDVEFDNTASPELQCCFVLRRDGIVRRHRFGATRPIADEFELASLIDAAFAVFENEIGSAATLVRSVGSTALGESMRDGQPTADLPAPRGSRRSAGRGFAFRVG